MGVSGGKSSQASGQATSGLGGQASFGATDIWGQQIPGFAQLYNQAMGLQQQQQAVAPGTAQNLVAGYMPAVNAGHIEPAEHCRRRIPDRAFCYAEQRAGATATVGDVGDIGTNFARNIMPQLRTGAGIGGNMGGSREALARGVAAGDASRSISNAATDLYGQQYGIAANAAAGATDARLNAANALPGAASQAFNLGMSPFQSAWAPIAALAQILGDPTILQRTASGGWDLNRGSSSSQGRSSQFGLQLS